MCASNGICDCDCDSICFIWSSERMCILSANISLLQRPRLRVHPSPRWIESTMEELIDIREYEQALNLFDPHSSSSTDIARTVPLKACTKLHDTQRGRKIHRLLSDQSLRNSSIQTSLTHFYSTLPFRSLGSTRLTISVLLVQSNDVNRARQMFESIDQKSLLRRQSSFMVRCLKAGIFTGIS